MTKTQHPIKSAPMAGFFVKSLPDVTQVSIWADTIELSICLNSGQTQTLVDIMTAQYGNFIAPGSQVTRFDIPLDLLPS